MQDVLHYISPTIWKHFFLLLSPICCHFTCLTWIDSICSKIVERWFTHWHISVSYYSFSTSLPKNPHVALVCSVIFQHTTTNSPGSPDILSPPEIQCGWFASARLLLVDFPENANGQPTTSWHQNLAQPGITLSLLSGGIPTSTATATSSPLPTLWIGKSSREWTGRGSGGQLSTSSSFLFSSSAFSISGNWGGDIREDRQVDGVGCPSTSLLQRCRESNVAGRVSAVGADCGRAQQHGKTHALFSLPHPPLHLNRS